MSDFSIHGRLPPQQAPKSLGELVKMTLGLQKSAQKIVKLVGKLGSEEVFAKPIGQGIVAKSQKEFQKMMQNHQFVPIPTKTIASKAEAGLLKFHEVVFVKVNDLAKTGLSQYRMKQIQQITSSEDKSVDLKLIRVEHQLEAAFRKTSFYNKIRKSVTKQWSQPVEQSTLKKADQLAKDLPKIKLSDEQYKSLIKERTGGSNTIQDSSEKRKDWLIAEEFVRNKANKKEPLTLDDICQINALINGDDNEEIGGGVFRDSSIFLGGWGSLSYVGETDVIPLMSGLVQEINGGITKGKNPIVLAARAYQKMVSIHPFPDANGRTCRLVMDYVLLKAGLPPPSMGKNIEVAIFGEQRGLTTKFKCGTPTIAVEKVIKGLENTYMIIKQ